MSAEPAITPAPSLRRAVVVSVILGLALRLARLHEAPALDPLYSTWLLDSAFYDDMARGILSRDPSLDGPFLMAPLYGYFLAALYALRDALGMSGPELVFGVQAAMGAATAGLTALLGGRAGGRVGAWAAGLLTAVYPVAILYDAKLLSVTLATFLATLGALGLVRLWDRVGAGRPAGWLPVGAGLVLGLATVARGNLLISLPFLVLLLVWQGWSRGAGQRGAGLRAAALLSLGMLGPLSLSWAHNAASGNPALVSVNGGVNLYRGNNPYFIDDAVEPFRLPAERDALATRSRLIASIAEDRELSAVEADRYWTRRALAYWGSDPLRYGALLLRKTTQALGWREIGDNIDHEDLLRHSPVLGWIPPLYGPMVAVALVTIFGRARRRELLVQDAPLLVLLVTGVGSVALFFVVARYRLPFVPLWAAFAGAGLSWLVARVRAGEAAMTLRPALATVALGGLLSLSPVSVVFPWNWLAPPNPRPECLIDPHVLRDPGVENDYRLAFDQMMRGDKAGAEAAMRALTLRDPGHSPAGVVLAYLLLERGQVREAVTEAARVVKVDPCDEKGWFNLGNGLMRSGQTRAALGALHKAAELDPYDTTTQTALGQVWLAVGRTEEARTALSFSVRWDPKDWQARALLGRVALKESKPNEAAKLLDEALLLAPDQIDLWALRGLAALGLGDLEGAETALVQGEANQKLHPEKPPDPVLAALRKAIDAPLRMPDKLELVAKPRPGLGP